MKADIHPPFYQTSVTCACGNIFSIGTTIKEGIRVETCYNCHPFYTGRQKLIDTTGRVDRFRQRAEMAKKISAEKAAPKKVDAVEEAAPAAKKPAAKKKVAKK